MRSRRPRRLPRRPPFLQFRFVCVVGATLGAGGCFGKTPPRPSQAAFPPAARATPRTRTSEAPLPLLPFIDDDYGRALAEARARRLPLVVDAWAPWCHTCLSMRSFVFVDPAIRALADRFVWLAIDTEREQNATFVSALGVRTLPTLYVIEPGTGKPIVAWPGSLMASELKEMLEEAEAAIERPETEHQRAGEAAVALLRGHRASAEGKLEEAIVAYRSAIASAPKDWPKRPEAVDALVARLAERGLTVDCVTRAASEAPGLPAGTARVDVVRAALGCAAHLPRGAPERAHLMDLVALGERIASNRAEPMLADDRSDLYGTLVDALTELRRGDDAKRVARSWVAFLDEEASRAPTPDARAVFDAHRLLAYTAVGDPLRAVPMLQQSEGDFPHDYNPPARLAKAYLEGGRHAEALAATRRALDLAYGPRKLRLWALQADVYEAIGDRASARAAIHEALDFAKGLSLSGSYAEFRAALEKRLRERR